MSKTTNTAELTAAAFQFVQDVAAELNQHDLKLPSFPDAVIRIRKALEQDDCTAEKLTRLVASDQAVAGRLLRMANSALLKRGGGAVTDLKTAINRLGFVMVRNVAISIAVEQVFQTQQSGSLGKRMKGLWKDSMRAAALSYILAKRQTELNADEAFLAGLLHNVGKLFILTRARDHEEFLADDGVLEHVLDDWHGPIGKAIIETWGFSEAQAAAAEEYRDLERKAYEVDMADVVQAATLLAEYEHVPGEPFEFAMLGSCLRLKLDDANVIAIVRESKAEIQALAEALSS